MTARMGLTAALATLVMVLAASASPAAAQTAGPAASDIPSYKPPLRGAPGGRVGGASRGMTAAVPVSIELVAPDNHTGLTTSAAPVLYYFASRPVSEPMRLTISAPGQAMPLVETAIPAPRQAGLQPVRLADYRVQLQPNVAYAWSISVVLDPRSPSRDAVAT
ncbi:MAG: DUF928 domain-containing protein, partial [Alphaproteobacteria bacterium]|nr:DUF928 domain-containing protein [Alphaproteobacteria bacterium]